MENVLQLVSTIIKGIVDWIKNSQLEDAEKQKALDQFESILDENMANVRAANPKHRSEVE